MQIARVPTAVLADVTFRPDIDPAAFSTTIDNPFMPLRPGTRMTYEGGDERIVIDVTSGTRVVMGVTTVAVRDRAYAGGRLIEDTEDWYAQDAAGNVWYFGEDTAECEGGAIVSRHGAWEAGVDGAEPGVVMLAQPRVGDHYRQEYYIGAAEDQARILRLRDTVEGPAGTFDDVLVTEDFTPLEPDHLEHKSYARGVGVVREATIRGGSGTLQLIDIETRGGTDPAVGAFDPCRE